jgi:hypothetical protein
VSLLSDPFVPKPAEHEPVVPLPLHLETDVRAERRIEFQRHLKQQRDEAEEAAKRRRNEQQVCLVPIRNRR